MVHPSTERLGPFGVALAAAAATAAFFLAYAIVRYVNAGGFFDHIEPNLGIAAWRMLEGHPLYQGHGEWPIFGNYYGPMIYLTHAGALAVAGGSLAASKLANSLAAGGAVILFFLYARRRFGPTYACAGTLMFLAFMLLFAPYTIWVRPDPFVIFLVTLAIFSRDLPRDSVGKWTPHLIIGACIGLAVNFRVHSFIYFLPVMIDLCGWRNIRQLAIIVLFSLVVFLAPFTLEQISLVDYVSGLARQVTGRSNDISLLWVALRYLLPYLSPLLVLFALLARGRNHVAGRDAVYFAALCGSILFIIYPATFSAAGPYHFLPLAPITVDAVLRFSRGFADKPKAQMAALALIPAVLLAISIPVQRRLDRNLNRMETETVAEEVMAIARRYQGETVQMGYGQSFESYRLTFVKPVLAYAGQPVIVDSHVIMELSSVGVDVIPHLIEEFSSCRTRHWLIPKDEPPFRLKSYNDNHLLFGKSAETFVEHYEKTATYKYFDLWSCKG